MSYGYYQPYWLNAEDELEHFGIKGMKWGIRRYQNADGTLTILGKQRYYSSLSQTFSTLASFKSDKIYFTSQTRPICQTKRFRSKLKSLLLKMLLQMESML